MSKNTKKKSTTKYKNFKMSPMVPIIAVIEIIILVCVSSYAWFVFSKNKNVGISQITVDADSGLDIDYKDADKNSFININDYIDNDFAFEPATSLDGKNIYFPTTGTFNNADTSKIIFRDGTVNDINSKYLSIDFELSNTANDTMEVYLSNNSTFTVFDNVGSANSAALRLALYQNDGSTGNVKSELISKTGQSTPTSDEHTKTVYFLNNSDTNWSDVYAYVWSTSGTGTQEYLKSWPGARMQKVCGKIYSYTFLDEKNIYDKVIFSNGNDDHKTADLNLVNGHIYERTATAGSPGTQYTTQTVYFLKPDNWNDVYCHAWKNGGAELTSWPGDKLREVAAGVYSYTFSTDYNRVVFNDNRTDSEKAYQTVNISCSDNQLYYITSHTSGTGCNVTNKSFSMSRVYFYNSLGWDEPYARLVTAQGYYSNYYKCVPMVALTGNVFYCDFPSIFCENNANLRFSSNADPYDSSNLTLQSTNISGYIYRPLDATQTEEGKQRHRLESQPYDNAVGDGTYAVVSPGVSAGFQRSYNPVLTINNETGQPSAIVPAFASSFDNYIYGSGNPLFSLESGETSQLSLIIWLEGTDIHCTGENYAAKNISLNLEFSTTLVHEESDGNYKYRFVDATKEMWTSDRITNPITGVSVDPVMQLYDVDAKRGYLMTPASYGTYNDKIKVEVWECNAPQSLITEVFAKGEKQGRHHHLMFRRVNPYNEDEVWNYWDAGTCTDGNNNILDDAFNSATGTVSFTAFADGSPTKVASGSVVLPELSCGGLWGQYQTKIISVYDGSKSHYFINDQGVVTLNYTYTYKDTNTKTQTIEYKASFDKNFYDLVVPVEVYDGSDSNNSSAAKRAKPDLTLKRYYNFNDGYALNINDEGYNDNLIYERSVTAGECGGLFYEISQTNNTDSLNNNYWGSDVIYVQGESCMVNDLKNQLMQIHFYNGSSSSSNDFYSYLYYDYNYRESENNDVGFACVVPNNKSYINYRVERVKSDGSEKYNYTNKIEIKNHSQDTSFTGKYLNSVEKNLCKITNYYKTIYFQTNMSGYGNDPYIWFHKRDDESHNTPYPGYKMEHVATYDSWRKYKLTVNISNLRDSTSTFDIVRFVTDHDSSYSDKKSRGYTLDDITKEQNGQFIIWQSESTSDGFTVRNIGTESGTDAKESLGYSLFNADGWH